MNNGVFALAASPLLALLGVLIGKLVDARRNRDDVSGSIIRALQAEVERRDRVDADRAAAHQQALAAAQARSRRLEDYCYALRAALEAAGVSVPGWPAEERIPA